MAVVPPMGNGVLHSSSSSIHHNFCPIIAMGRAEPDAARSGSSRTETVGFGAVRKAAMIPFSTETLRPMHAADHNSSSARATDCCIGGSAAI
jgi:hypothetical protein